MLSDEEKRAKYDRDGVDATEEMDLVDPSTFFTALFGSEAFEPYIGKLALGQFADQAMQQADAAGDDGAGAGDLDMAAVGGEQKRR